MLGGESSPEKWTGLGNGGIDSQGYAQRPNYFLVAVGDITPYLKLRVGIHTIPTSAGFEQTVAQSAASVVSGLKRLSIN